MDDHQVIPTCIECGAELASARHPMSERDHICLVRRADPVDGRPAEGWLMECSCGLSVGNFAEYANAFDEGRAHLDTIRADAAVRRLVLEERSAGAPHEQREPFVCFECSQVACACGRRHGRGYVCPDRGQVERD
jgi:hypothetical protein